MKIENIEDLKKYLDVLERIYIKENWNKSDASGAASIIYSIRRKIK